MLRSKLNYKLILATISSLLLVTGVFFYFLYTYHRAQLTEGLITSTTNLSKLVQQGLEYAMISRRENLLQMMVYRLAEDPDVEQIYILDPTGTIRVSSDKARVGYTIDRNSPTCQLCHNKEPDQRSTTAIFSTGNGHDVLRNVTPIFNKGECHGCHNPSQRINGVLIMDFSMGKINAQLDQNIRTMLVMTGIMVIVLAGVIGAYTNRLVLGRLKAVVETTQQVGAGDLSARVEVVGTDELSQLGNSFNQMASKLHVSVEELLTTQEYLKHLINSVDDGIVVVDSSLHVVMANEAYMELVDRTKDEVIGSECADFCHHALQPCRDPILDCPARKTFESGRLHKTIVTLQDKSEFERTLEIFSSPIRDADGEVNQVVEVVRDITERQRLEATLLHSEHLASLGMLAAGVSHEINNPLGSIATAIEGLRRRFAEKPYGGASNDDVAEYLELIRKEVDRCKQITNKLLILARNAPHEARWVDLRTAIEETVSLVGIEAERRGVALSWSWEDNIPPVKADDVRLRQVLLNILMNAIQATEAKGFVKVEGKLNGDELNINVVDSGCGIHPNEIKRIFEPFYTNKPVGQGTGLGLFISKNIVMEHGGDIVVQSQVGVGTTMTVVLPIDEDARDSVDTAPEERRHLG